MTRLPIFLLLMTAALLPPMPAAAQDREMAALNRVCRTLIDSGDDSLASTTCNRVHQDITRLAPGSPEHLASLRNLAELKSLQNNNLAADMLLTEALAQVEQGGGGDSLVAAELLSQQGESKIARGKIFEAEPLLRRALALREKRDGPTSLAAAAARVRHATVLGMLQQFQEAGGAYRRSLAVYQRGAAATRADYLQTRYLIAELLSRQARYAQAQAEYQRLLDDAGRAPADTGQVIVALDRLAWIASQDGHHDAAIALYRRQRAALGRSPANAAAARAVELRIEALAALATGTP